MTLILLSYVILYDVKTKALSFIMVIAAFWAITHILQPYDDLDFKYFNQILEASNFFFIALIFFSLYSRDNSYSYLQSVSDIIVISLNVFFAVLMLVVLCVIFKNRIKRMARWVKLKYNKFQSKKIKNKKQDSCWKKLKLLFWKEKEKDEILDDSKVFDIMIEESQERDRQPTGDSDGNVEKNDKSLIIHTTNYNTS